MFAKIDHDILTDTAIAKLSMGDRGVFIMAIVFCSREETDGHFSAEELATACHSRGLAPAILRLCSAGVVAEVGQGYVIKSYLKYQTAKKAIDGKRAETAARVEKHRASKKANVTVLPSTETQSTENKDTEVQSTETKRVKKTTAKKNPTPLPEGFVATARTIEVAKQYGHDIEALIEAVRDWAAGDNILKLDWNAQLRNSAKSRGGSGKFCRNAPQLPRQGGFRSGTTTPQQAQMDRQMERIRQAEAEEKASPNHPQIVEMKHDQN